MGTRALRRVTGFAVVLAALGPGMPGLAGPGGQAGGPPVAGTRSLGDPLLPQLGNGGYDARRYRIELDYDPVANRFDHARTTIIAAATQTLSEFSLDFQDELEVLAVTVNGRTAGFRFAAATPDLSEDPAVTQPMKLVVTPHASALPKVGRRFSVVVEYRGTPREITDPDTSIEGWIRACFLLNPPQTCDGAFVVNEPMGAQSWFPSNNYPTDKARFDTLITVPSAKTALGIGELVRRTVHGDGTSTWHWREDDPTATHLTTATATSPPPSSSTSRCGVPVGAAPSGSCSRSTSSSGSTARSGRRSFPRISPDSLRSLGPMSRGVRCRRILHEHERRNQDNRRRADP